MTYKDPFHEDSMLKNTFLVIAALGMLTTGCTLDDSLDSDTHESHTWGSYHWARTSNPFSLTLGDNLTSTWDPYLVDARDDWNDSSVLSTSIVNGGTKPRRCSAQAGKVEVCNTTYGNTGWLGIAGISIDGSGHITKGYVKLNDTYFNTASYNTPEWRRLVTCQEVGHVFGLGHQDENFDNNNLNTCMDYTNSPASNQHPNNHDYNLLDSIYSHLDSYDTAGFSNGSTMELYSDESDWGELVETSKDGVKETYMKALPDGETLVTDVFWAPDAHRDPGAESGHTH